MKLLEGKTAIITGAAKGIGKGIALKFAEQGANIAFTYLSSEEQANALEIELGKFGVKVKGYKSDASDFAEAERFIGQVMEDFGQIDALVNNAGITRDGLLMRMNEENWDAVLNTNLKSVFNLVKFVMKAMLKQRSGSIINMGSVVGTEGNPGQSNYAASKAGIVGFSKSIAQELGKRNIRCNVIAPGFIETEMTAKMSPELIETWVNDIPMNRTGSPEDVANMALFLASDLSTYVSGQVLNVCGALQT